MRNAGAHHGIIGAMRAAPRVTRPYVWHKPGVCGGSAVIRGTRFPVWSLVEYVLRGGMTPEEIVRDWDYLTLAQVHGALAYYYDHEAEIDRDIRENRSSWRRRRISS